MRRIVKTSFVIVGVFVIVVMAAGMLATVIVIMCVSVLMTMRAIVFVNVVVLVLVTVGMSVLVIRAMHLMAVWAVIVVVLLLASVLVFAFVRHFLSPGCFILSYYFSPVEKFYNASVGCLTKTNP